LLQEYIFRFLAFDDLLNRIATYIHYLRYDFLLYWEGYLDVKTVYLLYNRIVYRQFVIYIDWSNNDIGMV
jgi:hypothetical protein